ncbi:MAG: hydroxyethylthiazole kinase-like uncharacterized protein yjeF [Janthinobacterium sp.]|jgi:hydroxyethylthiazole kinase-like uncharacterized protein yjeF
MFKSALASSCHCRFASAIKPLNEITAMTSPQPLYFVAQIRAIERSAAQQLAPGALMQRAGRAGAELALALLSDAKNGFAPSAMAACRVLLLVGPGNNGGDALETGALLAQAGVGVSLWMAPAGATDAPSAERSGALMRARALHVVTANDIAEHSWDLVIDGLFGIGLMRPLSGQLRQIVERVNDLRCLVLALDVPSGLDADTGAIVGQHGSAGAGVAVHATHTLTFIGDKPGLHTCDGRDYAGIVQVAHLDIDAHHVVPAGAYLNHMASFAHCLHARRHNTHKGSFGNVAILGGAHGMTGAPILSARAALFSGAGRVFIAFPDTAPAYDSAQPELMCRQGRDFNVASATLVAGPGLGSGIDAVQLLTRAIDSDSALLIDADGLNLIAASPVLQAALVQRRDKLTILTPHPLEAARLLGIAAIDVQADRLAAARMLALQSGAIVVLKGSGTIIAAADGRLLINTTGNAALASAGTGDVLSGLCGALLAQGWPAWEAALAGVWLHGTAADDLVSAGVGPIGLTAGELIPALRLAINRAIHQANHRSIGSPIIGR